MSVSNASPRRWSWLVAGQERETAERVEVTSPYDGRLVAEAAFGDEAMLDEAIAAAAAAAAEGLPVGERVSILEGIADRIEADVEELAGILSDEVGKPIKLARGEVGRAAATFRAAAVAAQELRGEMVPLPHAEADGKLAFTLRKPLGVVAAITPFNFPLNLAAHKVAPAIAAGCPVVLKPAEKAPGGGFRLGAIAADAGLPEGWLNVVLGPPREFAAAFARDERIRLITFTGSAAVGHALAEAAAPKRVALELGNVGPAIVAADADLEVAAERIAASAFGFAGQTCLSTQRIFVEEAAKQRFLEAFAAAAEALVVGDPADPRTDVGPLIDTVAADRVSGLIEEARTAGAEVLVAGARADSVLAPTVLVDPRPDARIAREEAFGPVVAVWGYDDLDEALRRANETAYGLQAAIFTADLDSALRAARELDFGGVIVNDSPSFREDSMPYGGVKLSGNTREGPRSAVAEMTEEVIVVLDSFPPADSSPKTIDRR